MFQTTNPQKPLEEENPAELEVEIDCNHMNAWVRVIPRKLIKRELLDTHWQHELKLSWKEQVIEFRDITAADILEVLSYRNITFGIDSSYVKEAAAKADGSWYLVAQGKEPQKGKDGYVELKVETEVVPVFFNIQDLSRVDLRERVKIPAVKEGDYLAVVHPPLKGEQGKKLTGEKIAPPPAKEIKVRCKEGCQLDESGKNVIALRDGKPNVTGDDCEIFSVTPVHVHNGDVNIKSGHLRFSGEVIVTGNVEEKMMLECQGSLEVQGSAMGAILKTEATAVVRKNLINTTLLAGITKKFYMEIFPHIEKLEKELNNLVQIVKQVSSELLQQKGKTVTAEEMKKLVFLVVQRKCSDLPEQAENIKKCLKKAEISHFPQLEKDLKGLCVRVQELCNNGTYHAFFLEKLLDDVRSILEHLKGAKKVKGDVIAKYFQNCFVAASGDIIVQEKGSYCSVLDSGGDVHINGVFRGGAITAKGRVYIKEAGSPASVQSTIYLSFSSLLKMEKVYENTVVFFDGISYKFTETAKKVKMYFSTKEDTVKVTQY